MEDKLGFLAGDAPAEPVIAPVIDAPAPEPTPEGPARGADGKFVAASPEPAPVQEAPPVVAPEPAPAAPIVPPPEPGHVPISALMDERDKRKAAEERAARYEQQERQNAAPLEPDEQFRAELRSQRLHFSRELANTRHTPDLVTKAHEWAYAKADADPLFNQKALQAPDPYEFAVQEYQRDQIVSQVTPADLAAFNAWRAAQAALTPQAGSPATPTPVAAPPRSLASATSAGGVQHIPTGDGQAYDGLFKG